MRAIVAGASSPPAAAASVVALPPTARTTSAAGGWMPSRATSISARTAASSSSAGGSECRWRAASVPEPIGSDVHHVTPSRTVPVTSSDDPPPTSITPIAPAGGDASVASAPAKASVASCSLAEDLDVDARDVVHRGAEVVAVARAADRRRAHDAHLTHAVAVGRAHVRGHDLRQPATAAAGIAPS